MTTPVSEMLQKGRVSESPEAYYDSIAGLYDAGKKKNLYYFNNLVGIYNSLIPPHSKILDIGCGTGDLTTRLNGREALGIDLSEAMIRAARQKYGGLTNVRYERMDIFDSMEPFDAEFITMADVLEHVVDVPAFMKQIFARAKNDSKAVITVINPIWEPVLMVAEKLHLKIPEGPHKRLTIEGTERIFRDAGWKIVQSGYRFLVPKKLPFSDWVNRRFYKNKILARFGLVIFWVLSK